MTKENSSSNSTTKTTVVNDYFSMTRDGMPSWMYPALNREAWDEYSEKLANGLQRYARHHEFIRALAWFYGVDIDDDSFAKPDIQIDMVPYTDGHAKAPQAILFLDVCDASDGKVDRKYRLEMTWVDYYMVSQRYIRWVAERQAI